MNKEEKPDTLFAPQATVWPPSPTSPIPKIDPRVELVEAITNSIKWSALSFMAGCISPLAINIVFELLLHLSDKAVNILHNCIWLPLLLAAAYHGGRACLLAREAKSRGLFVQGSILVVLSLVFICVSLWLSVFG